MTGPHSPGSPDSPRRSRNWNRELCLRVALLVGAMILAVLAVLKDTQ